MSAKSKIVIRKATEADIHAVCAITAEAFDKYARDLGDPTKVKALYEDEAAVLRDINEKNVLLGFLNGEPMGSIRFEILPGKAAYISRFGVRLIAQGAGMGRALIRAVQDQCREYGIRAIALHTSARMASLMRFYYGQGFFVHSTSHDRGYIRALMVNELGEDYDLSAIWNK